MTIDSDLREVHHPSARRSSVSAHTLADGPWRPVVPLAPATRTGPWAPWTTVGGMSPSSPAHAAGISAGAATALVDALVADVAGTDVARHVAAHRVLRESPAGRAVGPVVVPVSRLAGLLDALDHGPRSTPLGVLLRADTGLVEAAEARAVLLDDIRVELVGLQVALPADGPLGDSASLTLHSLDFALPATIAVPNAPGWRDAVTVLAEDGVERALVPATPFDAEYAAELVVACVRVGLGLAFAAGHQPLPALAAVAAALQGREPAHVHALLVESDPVPLLAVMADADPVAVRRSLAYVGADDAAAALVGLVVLGLLQPDEG